MLVVNSPYYKIRYWIISYVIVAHVLVSRPNPWFSRQISFIIPDLSMLLSMWSTLYAKFPFWVCTREPQCLVNEWLLVVLFYFYGRNLPKPTYWIISALNKFEVPNRIYPTLIIRKIHPKVWVVWPCIVCIFFS